MHPHIYHTIAQAHVDDLERAAAGRRIADAGVPGYVGLLGRLSVLAASRPRAGRRRPRLRRSGGWHDSGSQRFAEVAGARAARAACRGLSASRATARRERRCAQEAARHGAERDEGDTRRARRAGFVARRVTQNPGVRLAVGEGSRTMRPRTPPADNRWCAAATVSSGWVAATRGVSRPASTRAASSPRRERSLRIQTL